jgi:hypothetical protein
MAGEMVKNKWGREGEREKVKEANNRKRKKWETSNLTGSFLY